MLVCGFESRPGLVCCIFMSSSWKEEEEGEVVRVLQFSPVLHIFSLLQATSEPKLYAKCNVNSGEADG